MDDSRVDIDELVQQLRAMGYHSHQVNNIIREAVGSKKNEELSTEEKGHLITVLQDYIAFARKSQKLT